MNSTFRRPSFGIVAALGAMLGMIPSRRGISREINPEPIERTVKGKRSHPGLRRNVRFTSFQKPNPQRWSNRGGLTGRERRRGIVSHRKKRASR